MKKKIALFIEKVICVLCLLASALGIIMAVLLIMTMFIPPYDKYTLYKFIDAMCYAFLSLFLAGISMLMYYNILSKK